MSNTPQSPSAPQPETSQGTRPAILDDLRNSTAYLELTPTRKAANTFKYTGLGWKRAGMIETQHKRHDFRKRDDKRDKKDKKRRKDKDERKRRGRRGRDESREERRRRRGERDESRDSKRRRKEEKRRHKDEKRKREREEYRRQQDGEMPSESQAEEHSTKQSLRPKSSDYSLAETEVTDIREGSDTSLKTWTQIGIPAVTSKVSSSEHGSWYASITKTKSREDGLAETEAMYDRYLRRGSEQDVTDTSRGAKSSEKISKKVKLRKTQKALKPRSSDLSLTETEKSDPETIIVTGSLVEPSDRLLLGKSKGWKSKIALRKHKKPLARKSSDGSLAGSEASDKSDPKTLIITGSDMDLADASRKSTTSWWRSWFASRTPEGIKLMKPSKRKRPDGSYADTDSDNSDPITIIITDSDMALADTSHKGTTSWWRSWFGPTKTITSSKRKRRGISLSDPSTWDDDDDDDPETVVITGSDLDVASTARIARSSGWKPGAARGRRRKPLRRKWSDASLTESQASDRSDPDTIVITGSDLDAADASRIVKSSAWKSRKAPRRAKISSLRIKSYPSTVFKQGSSKRKTTDGTGSLAEVEAADSGETLLITGSASDLSVTETSRRFPTTSRPRVVFASSKLKQPSGRGRADLTDTAESQTLLISDSELDVSAPYQPWISRGTLEIFTSTPSSADEELTAEEVERLERKSKLKRRIDRRDYSKDGPVDQAVSKKTKVFDFLAKHGQWAWNSTVGKALNPVRAFLVAPFEGEKPEIFTRDIGFHPDSDSEETFKEPEVQVLPRKGIPKYTAKWEIQEDTACVAIPCPPCGGLYHQGPTCERLASSCPPYGSQLQSGVSPCEKLAPEKHLKKDLHCKAETSPDKPKRPLGAGRWQHEASTDRNFRSPVITDYQSCPIKSSRPINFYSSQPWRRAFH
ncbi:hypothetical protein ElyMa_006634300 [Elysia marginata]|uniref:Uncharacterized protein n=1 Tax=Elysia marginata TaxID=1093978 RepID=A0AAV4IJI7_9GAST|nr:hypothetical protein ElyMa_006634300 [Elysia marginata]